MPDGFEYLVRPFQAPGSLGSVVIPSTPTGTQERAHLTWSGKGTMPEVRLTGVDFTTQKSPKQEALEEKRRASKIQRIEQEGKPENYVDVARAETVDLLKEELGSLDQLGEQQYAASGLDPRLLAYEADIYKNPEKTLSKVSWKMKNQ